jgi:hypothetical protein
MQITIVLDTTLSTDMAALAALVASLGGRTVVTAPQSAAPPAPTDHPITADRTSESLIANEAARVAGEPTGSTNTGGESPAVDSSGLPWDERIHGLSADGTKPQNANGTWRKKRGVSDELVAQIEAELRGPPRPTSPAAVPAPPAPASDATAPITAPPAPPVTPDVADTASGPVVAETAASVPAPPAPAVAADGARFPTYADLVRAVSSKGLAYEALNKHASDLFGVPQFIALRDRPDSWDMFYDALPA